MYGQPSQKYPVWKFDCWHIGGNKIQLWNRVSFVRGWVVHSPQRLGQMRPSTPCHLLQPGIWYCLSASHISTPLNRFTKLDTFRAVSHFLPGINPKKIRKKKQNNYSMSPTAARNLILSVPHLTYPHIPRLTTFPPPSTFSPSRILLNTFPVRYPRPLHQSDLLFLWLYIEPSNFGAYSLTFIIQILCSPVDSRMVWQGRDIKHHKYNKVGR